jgi:asparagine synthase (glutamine-hydrolysing)
MLNAVDLRLRADVKVAFELSGGLDSSSIVAAAAALGHRDVTTFTIAVPESDETPYARSMLQKYPLDFRVLSDPEERFASDGAEFARLIEEPYHSPNIYTHYRMRQRMKGEGVSVVLSGSGGDEVLAGYESDFWTAAATDLRARGRHGHALAYELVRRAGTWRRAGNTLRGAAHGTARWALRKGTRRDSSGNGGATGNAHGDGARLARGYPCLTFDEQMRYHLRIANLPYYLRSNDHFTMSIPIEHRFPFLDYRLVELGLTLPTAYLFRHGWTKYILRKAMEPFLPRRIAWRREKMGFPFPLRRFLSSHRERFTPLLAATAAAGLTSGGEYDGLVRDAPLRLWRAVSTGLWLDATEARV